MRRLGEVILLAAVGTLPRCLAKTKDLVFVRTIRHASQINERTSTYTSPGTSNTGCSGTGTTDRWHNNRNR